MDSEQTHLIKLSPERNNCKDKLNTSNIIASPSPILSKRGLKELTPVSFLSSKEEEEDDEEDHFMIPRLCDISLTTKCKKMMSNIKYTSFVENKKNDDSGLFPFIDKQNSSFLNSTRNKTELDSSILDDNTDINLNQSMINRFNEKCGIERHTGVAQRKLAEIEIK